MRLLRNSCSLFAAAALFAAVLTSGCGKSRNDAANPGSGSGGGGSAPAAKEGPIPNYDTTPMTQADVDLYINVMQAAAAYIKNPSSSDKAAMEFAKQVSKGKAPSTVSPEQAQMLARAATLAQYDMEIANQRGISKRYEAIRGTVEGLVGMTACPTCSGDGGGPATQQQKDQAAQADAAHKADLVLLQPHSDEIVALQKQIRGVLMGG
jgi:hypothetical protein